jgi:DNA polymerase bacteriophage-type
MRPIVIDFETEFSDTYTLSKMSTESYIRDSRFKAHGAAIKWKHDIPARWYDARQLELILKQEDWSDVLLICHHTAFDGLILRTHYDIVPKMYGCTMSMAAALFPIHISKSLDSVRERLGFPPKRTPYNLFRGKHWNELDRQTQQTLAEGCEDEVESIWQIFKILSKDFPLEEYPVVDFLIRMFVNPVLRADTSLLGDLWESEAVDKKRRLEALGIREADVQSADKFQALLEAEGVEIQTKPNPKAEMIPQFAKKDDFMEELLEHDNERIRTLAEARIGAKSTLLQTRAETLGWMASRGPLCVYLRYCGAATLRPTGGDGANWLNFKRGSAIRRSILAPEGYLLGPVDASQIEARCLAYLAEQDDAVEKWKNGEDLYCAQASACYGEEIYKPKKGDPREDEMVAKRGMGKQAVLMCGYGASGPQFKRSAKAGLYGPPVELSSEEAGRFVDVYRQTNPRVVDYWKQCNRIIARLAGGPPIEWGPFLVKDHRLILPSGQAMNYESLEFHRPNADEECKEFERDGYWRMRVRRGYKKMWGSKLTQNICEMVSRVIVSQAMVRIKRQYGIRTLNWPYDELLLLIPDNSKAEETLELCRQEMCKTPEWLPGIPLDAEASLGVRYSK